MSTIYGNEKKELLTAHFNPDKLKQHIFILTGLHFAVRNVSLWKIGTPWEVPRRQINDVLMWLVMEGEFTAIIDGKVCQLTKGSGVIVPEYVSHSFAFSPGCTGGKVFIIHADIFLYSGKNFADTLRCFTFTPKFPEHLFDMLSRCVAMHNADRDSALAYARNPVRELLLACAENEIFRTDFLQVEDIRIRCAINFVRNNYMHNISIPDIAAEAKLAEVQFRNLFRKYTGFSPSDYLKHLRLRRAAELLSGTPAPIKEISKEAGFNSESYFCLVFRQYYGVSPENYRKHSFDL